MRQRSLRGAIPIAAAIVLGLSMSPSWAQDASQDLELWDAVVWSDSEGTPRIKALRSWKRNESRILDDSVFEVEALSGVRLEYRQGEPSPRVMRWRFVDLASGWVAELEIDTLLLNQPTDRIFSPSEIAEAMRAGTISTRYSMTTSDGFRVDATDPRESTRDLTTKLTLEELFAPALANEKSTIESVPESAVSTLRVLRSLARAEKRPQVLDVHGKALELFYQVFARPTRSDGSGDGSISLVWTGVTNTTRGAIDDSELGPLVRRLRPSAGAE